MILIESYEFWLLKLDAPDFKDGFLVFRVLQQVLPYILIGSQHRKIVGNEFQFILRELAKLLGVVLVEECFSTSIDQDIDVVNTDIAV
jgi:hypothetical protein